MRKILTTIEVARGKETDQPLPCEVKSPGSRPKGEIEAVEAEDHCTRQHQQETQNDHGTAETIHISPYSAELRLRGGLRRVGTA